MNCSDYNYGIDRNVRRFIHFLPFGDNIDEDLNASWCKKYTPDENDHYEAYFQRAIDTHAECVTFLETRRNKYSAVYNSRRLEEIDVENQEEVKFFMNIPNFWDIMQHENIESEIITPEMGLVEHSVVELNMRSVHQCPSTTKTSPPQTTTPLQLKLKLKPRVSNLFFCRESIMLMPNN